MNARMKERNVLMRVVKYSMVKKGRPRNISSDKF